MDDIKIFRGDTVKRNVNFTVDGEALDITGWTVSFTVRRTMPSTAIITDAGVTISKVNTSHVDPTQGKTAFVLSKTDTNLEPGNYFYDIQTKNLTGEVTTIGVGKFIVDYDITRA